MAWKLAPGKTYTHPFSEVPINSAYILIDSMNIDKKAKSATISLLAYVNRSARLNGKEHVKSYSINVSESDFMTYFNPTFTTSIWTQANNFLADGGLAGTGLVVSDWVTDGSAEP